jgi:putative tRNA adenosine deaminase-associated protein
MNGDRVAPLEATTGMGADAVDFALAAYREEGAWQVDPLPPSVGADLDEMLAVLRQRPGDSGALGFVSVDEDFFLFLRVLGRDARFLLSDVTAATEWPIARAVLDRLGLPVPGGDDVDHVQPAGDLRIVADLGIDAMAMGAICDDLDAYPDEQLGIVAERLGFAAGYEKALATLGSLPTGLR